MNGPNTTGLPKPTDLPLVIGLGNDDRGDDRSGLEVARALRRRLAGSARVEECVSGGVALLELWRDSDRVVVVDAVRSGAPPGTVHRLDPGGDLAPGFRTGTSTHGLSLGEVIGLARGLGRLPRHLVVYGIEGANFGVGDELTPSVAQGVKEATERITLELGTGTSPRGGAARSDHA
jgi:hydrogenase maturation protease